jgi:hypothetical protein
MLELEADCGGSAEVIKSPLKNTEKVMLKFHRQLLDCIKHQLELLVEYLLSENFAGSSRIRRREENGFH